MKRNVFVQLRTLIYVTIVAVLSINLMACEPETPETPETPEVPEAGSSNNGQVDTGGEEGATDDSQGGDDDGGNTENTPKETITIGKYGCEAYCSASALDFSKLEGLKAYVATGYDDGVVIFTRVKTVKYGEGILVKGTPGDYEVPVLERSNDNTLNLLVGVLENTMVQAKSKDGLNKNYYWNPANTCFEPITESMVLENSAYIQVPTEWISWTGAELRFDEGDSTNAEKSK